MNRDALVEKVWQSITANSLDAWAAASEIVDAILPQVTTVEELDALYESADRSTLLIDNHGRPHRIGFIAAEVVENHGPLTVVWRPE